MSINWFHSHAFADGEEVRGIKSLPVLNAEADVFMKHGVAGKTVLDIGAWDGFFSFEAERRGASRVVATDHFCWSGDGWATRAGFDYARKKLGSKVEAIDVDVPDLSPAALGTFDVVMLFGVLYHTKDPFKTLEVAAAMCNDCLIVETETALDAVDIPLMRYHLGASLFGDPTNYWSPNVRCLQDMLREIGFVRFEHVPSPTFPEQTLDRARVVMHAWRS